VNRRSRGRALVSIAQVNDHASSRELLTGHTSRHVRIQRLLSAVVVSGNNSANIDEA